MPIEYSKGRTPGSGVSLSKVTLTKNAPTVSLSKQGGSAGGELRVNLNWTARPARSGCGVFGRGSEPASDIDLDLACLYELTDGTKGVVQALGNSLRSSNVGSAIIALDGDDRTGESVDGENLRIDRSPLPRITPPFLLFFL